MKFLESVPERYDRGIRLLSRGRIDDVYRRIAERVAGPGQRILDVGCGTGGVALACAALGAAVVAIDINAGMLEVARRKAVPPTGSVEWMELGMAEIEDEFPLSSFDAIVSCLAFSELSPDERRYALEIAYSRLVPGGQLVIADEASPRDPARRIWQRARRWPRSALTYLLTQTTTHPVDDLAERMQAAGFAEVGEDRLWSDTFVIARGRRPDSNP